MRTMHANMLYGPYVKEERGWSKTVAVILIDEPSGVSHARKMAPLDELLIRPNQAPGVSLNQLN